MTIAVDANTTNSAGTGSASFNHTATSSTTNPVKGVVVMFIGDGGSSTTEISSCSYASNAMTQIATTGVAGGAGDTGFVDMYFIGDQYTPGGTQTVSFTRSGTSSSVTVSVFSLTGTGALQVQSGSANTQSSTSLLDPNLLMEFGGANCLSFLAYFSGRTVGQVSDASAFTRYDALDFGQQSGFTAVQTTQSTTDFTFSFTASADDAALAGFAVKEVPIQIYTKASGTWYPAELSVYVGDPTAVNYPAHPYVLLNGRWIS